MLFPSRRTVIGVALFFATGVVVWYDFYAGQLSHMTIANMEIYDDGESNNTDGVKVTCKFPDFDPFNPEAMKYYEKFPTTSCPNGLPTITYYNGDEIRFNTTHKDLKLGEKEIECWYRSVTYRRHIDYINGDWQGPFNDSIKVPGKHEYVEVKCNDKQGTQVSRMHHYIVRKEERKNTPKPKRDNKNSNTERMNAIMLCLDSLASYLFKRAMPKTRTYLLDQLGAVELNRYNKVGDNTFPNLLAILSGSYNHDLKNWSKAQGYDTVPFLWKKFKAAGYRTQYMSDRHDFDDFSSPPTDSFNLPMAKSLMRDKIQFDNNCFEDQIEVKLWLDLILEFALESIYGAANFFTMGMMNRPTHDFPNQASAVDQYYLNFLQEANSSGILNNTLLAFFGDHGPRMSNYRRTFYGSIEERAANMVIYVPPWFKTKYPTHYSNLITNANRLTTNFDIHETFSNLLTLPATSSKTANPARSRMSEKVRGLSLFSEIPPDRTCEDADLGADVCLCNDGVSVVEPTIMNEIGRQVVKDINGLLQTKSHLCASLSLKSVHLLIVLEGKVGDNALYRVMIKTSPGDAMFEATVQYSFRFFVVKYIRTVGKISRINVYKGQSDCVEQDALLKMYCYCNDVLLDKTNLQKDKS